MPFIKGGSLFSIFTKKDGSFPEDIVKFFIIQIAIGLGYLHSKQIVYRDLKLENVLIGDDGYLLISDFGISKKIDKEGEQTYTQCGTLEYMAPEMLKAKGYK